MQPGSTLGSSSSMSTGPSTGAAVGGASTASAASATAQFPATYTVKPGDTLIRIGLDHGQNWRDIARWSGLENPNLIEVGQVLRVSPPGSEAAAAVTGPAGSAASAATRPVVSAGRVESRPLESRPTDGAVPATGSNAPVGSAGGARESAASAVVAASSAASPSVPSAPVGAARPGEETLDWAWPAVGTVVAGFDEVRGVKGLSIAGRAGDPVLAAADGRVVYAGSGLRGYGNLVIVKHNNTFLTAYAHNQTLLVKEDQAVRRGQKIAEMGSSEADRVKLHFEIRRLGKPVDPTRLLPSR